MSNTNLLRTCLFELHNKSAARMVPFAGWEMPVQYESIPKEHNATRESIGIFDVGHMGRLLVRGPDAVSFVNRLVARDITRLKPWQAGYTVVCNENGGVRDDVLVYRGDGEDISLVVNGSNRTKIVDWFERHRKTWNAPVEIEDNTLRTGMVAIQGPDSESLVKDIVEHDVSDLGYYRWREVSLQGIRIPLSRTGYTGEDGFELSGPPELIQDLWKRVVRSGGKPCGLGARDTLRMEMGYPLYGHELEEDITPLEAGLNWVVHLSKEDFIGRDALMAQKKEGCPRRLTGFVLTDRGIPRESFPVLSKGKRIGTVTSGGFSPTRSEGIGLAYVEPGGVPDAVEIRGRSVPVCEETPPFVPSHTKLKKKSS